jgi:hypothetical protein
MGWCGSETANYYAFLCANGNANHQLGTFMCIYIHKRMILAVKRVEFVSGRISYIILSGHWCDTIVFNSPTEDKSDDEKDIFYEELVHAFSQFLKYLMRILVRNFSAKGRREDIFRLVIGNKSLNETNNDNGSRIGNREILLM